MKVADLIAALTQQKARHTAASVAIDGVITAIAAASDLPDPVASAAVPHTESTLFTEGTASVPK